MLSLKNSLKKIILGKKASSDTYISYLRSRGAYIGERTNFFSPLQISIDDTQPWLIEIGNDVQITAGVRILTHDYSWSVLKKLYGPIIGMAGKVKIGNNVFIGSDTTILGGTEIGENVIIGAGSVIKGKIPDNCVAAGVPCKPIMSIEEFYEKRINNYEKEAFELVNEYIKHFNKIPDKNVLHEFFFLFESGERLNKTYENKLKLCGNEKQSKEMLKNQIRKYRNYEEFLYTAQKYKKE